MGKNYKQKIITIMILIFSLFLSSCSFLEKDYYQFKMNWPDNFKVKVTTAMRNASNVTIKEIRYTSEIKEGNYILNYLDDKLIQHVASSNTNEDLSLIANIDNSSGMIISKNGKLKGLHNFEAYRHRLISRANSLREKYSKKAIQNVISFVQSDHFEEILMQGTEENIKFILTFWLDQKIPVNKKIKINISEIGPDFLPKDYPYYAEYSIVKVDNINGTDIITIHWKEYIEHSDLLKLIKKNDKFSNPNKFKYEIVRVIKTNPETLLPIKYLEENNIIMPDYVKNFSAQYEYDYEF